MPISSVCPLTPEPAIILPPVVVMVALPVPPTIAIGKVPVVLKFQLLAPLLTTIPSASVKLLDIYSVPLSVRLLPRVTPFRVPPLEVSTVPSPLISVPLMMSPLNWFSPPVRKTPALPMSSISPVLVRLPVIFTRILNPGI